MKRFVEKLGGVCDIIGSSECNQPSARVGYSVIGPILLHVIPYKKGMEGTRWWLEKVDRSM